MSTNVVPLWFESVPVTISAMRVVLQRVSGAGVEVDQEVVGSIGKGALVLLAVEQDDELRDLDWMCRKVVNLRYFADEEGRMNRSIGEAAGELLVVSQFTLYGDCKKGNRPSYTRSATPDKAESYYRQFLDRLRAEGITVATGRFGAMMEVHLVNDGPVTLILDSRQKI